MWEHRRMTDQDDPEARIRDLERPLADRARTSELGMGGTHADHPPAPPRPYGTPPPPPWSYGAPPPQSPWPYGPPVPAHTNRTPRTLITVLAVGTLVVAAGVAAFLMFGTGAVTVGTGRPTASSGGGSIPGHPSTTRPPRTAAPTAAAPSPAEPTPTVVQGGSLSIAGIDTNRTVVCDNGSVSVSGVDNTIVILGHCAALTVSGTGNIVTVESAGTIGVSGFTNRVTFRSGTPQIDTSGLSNIVEQG